MMGDSCLSLSYKGKESPSCSPKRSSPQRYAALSVRSQALRFEVIHLAILIPTSHNMKNTLHILRLIVHLAVDLRIGPLGFAACLSKNVPLSRSVCNVLGLMFSIWHTSWLSSQSPNPLSLPLLAISFIFVTKLLKLVSSSSQVLRSIDITSMSVQFLKFAGKGIS